MKTQTSKTASPHYNTQIGNPDSNGERWYPADAEKNKGKRMRKIEAIREIIDLGNELAEVWDDD